MQASIAIRKQWFATALMVLISCSGFSLQADPPSWDRKTFTETDKDGNTTNETFGFEINEKDKNGKITQWYQSFKDSDGKELIYICRVVPNLDKHPPYESIQLISTYAYNKDKNVTDEFEFYGDGTLRHHTVYKYTIDGNWIEGDIYDAKGKLIGTEVTPPEAHLYGKWKGN